MPSMLPVILIDRRDSLEDFVRGALDAAWLGLDTEFVRDRHYFPRAGLIQIATPGQIALVDPVAIDDLAPLAPLLFDTQAEKILHAARQDFELFEGLFGRVPAPLFDTQVAAAMSGAVEQIGYAALVAELLDTETPPALGRYDWLRRPLSDRAIAYAAGDVQHLDALCALLRTRLTAEQRESDFAAAMRQAENASVYRPDPERSWRRVRQARRLRGKALARLKLLAAWRERRAIAEDRPRQWVVRDGALVAIARLAPRSPRGFDAVDALSPTARRRYVPEILEVLSRCPDEDATQVLEQGT